MEISITSPPRKCNCYLATTVLLFLVLVIFSCLFLNYFSRLGVAWMAELYIFGQVLGANQFPVNTLFCKWTISAGNGWKLIEGLSEGQTQIDTPDFDDFTYWCHPIDLHYATKGIQGWPKLYLQVYHYDKHGRSELCSYGMTHLPTTPGTHAFSCCTWRPIGTYKEELQQYFLGGGVQLQDPELVYSGCNRYKLQTQSMGNVHFEMNIILRHFDKFGVEM